MDREVRRGDPRHVTIRAPAQVFPWTSRASNLIWFLCLRGDPAVPLHHRAIGPPSCPTGTTYPRPSSSSTSLLNPVVVRMSVAASRAVLRQSQFMIRRTAVRHSSSTSEAANKAKESAANAASKAQQGLSRVTSSAGPAIAGAASNIGSALRKVGGRTGKVIAYIDSKKRFLQVYC